MAGPDHTRSGKGPRHSPQTIGVLIGLCIGLASWPHTALAAFTIITNQGSLTTTCYRIQDNKLYLCAGEGLHLSEVMGIDTTGLTTEERAQHQAAMDACFKRLDVLMEKDAHIARLEAKNQEVLDYIVGLRATEKSGKRYQDALADAMTMLDQLEALALPQDLAWKNLMMPDRVFVKLRDIKILQYTVRILAYREWRMYLKSDDPTLREYARERYRQVQAFGVRFEQHLKEARTVAEHAMEPTGESVPSESKPDPVIIPQWPK
jgi:hypothetical protein